MGNGMTTNPVAGELEAQGECITQATGQISPQQAVAADVAGFAVWALGPASGRHVGQSRRVRDARVRIPKRCDGSSDYLLGM